MQALISIHDVMPETLDRVRELTARLDAHGHGAITLLVVPNRDWRKADIEQLAAWAEQGIELAAHGWDHRAERIQGLWHRLHSAFISRNAAEHLALDSEQIEALMHRSAAWFRAQGLPAPTSYVPPAWALGPLSSTQLADLPYRRIEVTRGILDTASGKLQPLPLVGFEADTLLRARFLRTWNRFQANQSQRLKRPLRIGIHPQDAQLKLADNLSAFIEGEWVSQRMDAETAQAR